MNQVDTPKWIISEVAGGIDNSWGHRHGVESVRISSLTRKERNRFAANLLSELVEVARKQKLCEVRYSTRLKLRSIVYETMSKVSEDDSLFSVASDVVTQSIQYFDSLKIEVPDSVANDETPINKGWSGFYQFFVSKKGSEEL